MSSEALLRMDKFTKLFPINFNGAPYEDTKDYLDHYREMIGSAKRWWRDYMLTRPAGSPELTWDQFSELFLEKFISFTLREDYHKLFKRLQQGSMIVTQYETRFVDLARYAIILLPTEREKVRKFIDRLTFIIMLQMTEETGDDISFQRAIDITRRIEMVHSQERGTSLR
ncbi:uncharacterized protein [Nicotiana tomentosiformis]|uniref:uncharacterized protein n=1 Tax=Nicotiana tomentosiformis TaxID=4098 RepID=UPI00388CD498